MKQYMIPTMETINIEVRQIIAASVNQSNGEATVEDGSYTNALARESDFDDEE